MAPGGDETMWAARLVGESAALAPDRPLAHLLDCRREVPRAATSPSYALLERCGLTRCRPLMLSGLGGLEWVAGLELVSRTALLDDGDAVVLQVSAAPATAIWAFRVSARAQPFAAVTVHHASVRPGSASTVDLQSTADRIGHFAVGEALRLPCPDLVRSIVLAGDDGCTGMLRVAAMEIGVTG
jgi:hypothetical protein